MNDWIGLSFLVMMFSVYGSIIYYTSKIQEITKIDISFLVSRNTLLKKRMKLMIQLSLLVAFINLIIFTLTLAISNTDNFGFVYNVFAGFLFFAGFEFCSLGLLTLGSIIHNIQTRTVMGFVIAVGIGMILFYLTKNEIWRIYHSIGTLMIFLSLAITYLIKETFKKCDIV